MQNVYFFPFSESYIARAHYIAIFTSLPNMYTLIHPDSLFTLLLENGYLRVSHETMSPNNQK